MFVYPTFRLTVNILNNDYWLDDTCIAHDIFQTGVYGLFEYLKYEEEFQYQKGNQKS
jgi:hypothetical protein